MIKSNEGKGEVSKRKTKNLGITDDKTTSFRPRGHNLIFIRSINQKCQDVEKEEKV